MAPPVLRMRTAALAAMTAVVAAACFGEPALDEEYPVTYLVELSGEFTGGTLVLSERDRATLDADTTRIGVTPSGPEGSTALITTSLERSEQEQFDLERCLADPLVVELPESPTRTVVASAGTCIGAHRSLDLDAAAD